MGLQSDFTAIHKKLKNQHPLWPNTQVFPWRDITCQWISRDQFGQKCYFGYITKMPDEDMNEELEMMTDTQQQTLPIEFVKFPVPFQSLTSMFIHN